MPIQGMAVKVHIVPLKYLNIFKELIVCLVIVSVVDKSDAT